MSVITSKASGYSSQSTYSEILNRFVHMHRMDRSVHSESDWIPVFLNCPWKLLRMSTHKWIKLLYLSSSVEIAQDTFENPTFVNNLAGEITNLNNLIESSNAQILETLLKEDEDIFCSSNVGLKGSFR